MLNNHFREFGAVSESCFPDDEFSKREARSLKQLCEEIQIHGYEIVEKKIDDEAFLYTLDTGAEYGVFVESEVGASYLGIFIVAQMLMEPSASFSFIKKMLRSSVYYAADSDLQKLARFLLFLATFVKNKKNRSSQYNMHAGFHLRTLKIDELDVFEIINVLNKKAVGSDRYCLKDFIYHILNSKYYNFSLPINLNGCDDGIFIKIYEMISKHGYESIEEKLADQIFFNALEDLATRVNSIFEHCMGTAYLGFFIFAQMLITPRVAFGFAEFMMKSSVYLNATPEDQELARFLLLLATFVEGKRNMEYEYYLYIMDDINHLCINEINIKQVFCVLSEEIIPRQNEIKEGV